MLIKRTPSTRSPLALTLPFIVYVGVSRSVVSDSLHPINCSWPGSSVRGILQARILKWIAIPFSRGSSQPRDWTQVSCIAGRFFTIWATRAALIIYNDHKYTAPLLMGNVSPALPCGKRGVSHKWSLGLAFVAPHGICKFRPCCSIISTSFLFMDE